MDPLRIRDREGVYPVSEDTLLLESSISVSPGERFLEIGCGTGYVSLSMALRGAVATGVDINPLAVALSRENAKRCGITGAAFFESDLFSAVTGTYDAIAFNPPYLPSEDIRATGYDACWDGGPTGREVSAAFIAQCARYLAPGGRVYLLQSSLCEPEKSREELESQGFTVEVVGTCPLFFEQLTVFCARSRRV